MYDQSYNARTLATELRRKDFRKFAPLSMEAYRSQLVQRAFESADTLFHGLNPIRRVHLKKKDAFEIAKTEDDLVVRKLARNLRRFINGPQRGRNFLVRNVQRMLEEGVPYKVFRFDVKSFYESVSDASISEVAATHAAIDPRSKQLLAALMKQFRDGGGGGVPRGIGLSAVLSELAMAPFDQAISRESGIYFYARYVDDILIITHNEQTDHELTRKVTETLPQGMSLNPKKNGGMHASDRVSTKTPGKFIGSVEYLGYKFSVFDPSSKERSPFRRVQVDIADSKINKIKTRIVRAFVAFAQDKDATLLQDRLRLLTSNFAITDVNTGRKRLAGIYHGYPQLTEPYSSLVVLDAFLKAALLSGKGRLFATTHALLTPGQRRSILRLSFLRGHNEHRFVHVHPVRIGQLQECWRHE